MIKKSVLLFVFVCVGMIASVGAVSITNSSVNDTLRSVSVSDAVELYAYEVNFIFDDSIDSIDFYDFLQGEGDGTTSGSDEKGTTLSVYESILESSSNGVNGSGVLFNVSYSGSLTMDNAVLIFANGTEMTINFSSGDVDVSNPSGPTPGGGSGGAGGASAGALDPITLSDDTLNIETFPGETVWKEVTLKNNRVSGIDVSEVEVQGLSGILEIDTESFRIPGSGTKDVVLKFEIPVDLEPEVYTGRVLFVTESFTATLNIIVEVYSVDGALFDVIVNFPGGNEFAPGEDVVAEIEVDNFGSKRGFDFDLFYAIKNFEGQTLAHAQENIAIETKVELIRELQLPNDVQPGEYVFTAKASHESAVASGSKTFNVRGVALSPFTGNAFLIILGVAVIVIAIVVVVVILHFRGKKKANFVSANAQG
jgi:hypothetical protein